VNSGTEPANDTIDAAYYETYQNLKGKPFIILLNVNQYKTKDKAQDVYNTLYETLTELGTRTEKNKESIKIGTDDAKLSHIRPDTGSNVVEILILKDTTLIRIFVADFSKYYQDEAIQLAKESID
jgi:hypothetical protein